jgi:hypothetical protein
LLSIYTCFLFLLSFVLNLSFLCHAYNTAMCPAWRNTITACVLTAVLAVQLPAQNIRQIIAANTLQEAPVICFQAAALGILLLQDGIQGHSGYGCSAGMGVRRHTAAKAYILLELNYQQFSYWGIRSRVYDVGFGTAVSLNTSLKMSSLEIPLLYGIEKGKLAAALGLTASFLLSAKINQDAEAGDSRYASAIFGKYTQKEVSGISPFYSGNLAPCLYFAWKPCCRFVLSFTASCALLSNPIPGYSYFASYRFIENSIVITFKI